MIRERKNSFPQHAQVMIPIYTKAPQCATTSLLKWHCKLWDNWCVKLFCANKGEGSLEMLASTKVIPLVMLSNANSLGYGINIEWNIVTPSLLLIICLPHPSIASIKRTCIACECWIVTLQYGLWYHEKIDKHMSLTFKTCT